MINWASLVAQMEKNPLAMQETGVPFLGWEDPLEDSSLDNLYAQLSLARYSP